MDLKKRGRMKVQKVTVTNNIVYGKTANATPLSEVMVKNLLLAPRMQCVEARRMASDMRVRTKLMARLYCMSHFKASLEATRLRKCCPSR